MDPVPGREAELARLESVCRSSLSGAGQLALLTGEAGIGKTFLAQAVVAAATDLGMTVVRGWCIDDPGAPTLWPWRRVGRDLVDLRPALDVVASPDPDGSARFHLVDAVGAVLQRAAGGSGLLVVLEDLHWADSLSLELLRGLLHEIEAMPVLFLGTAREHGLDATAFGRALPALLRAPRTVHISLGGLSPEAVVTWLRSDPETSTWAEHAEALVRRTGGNPFYIRSLTTELPAGPEVDVPAALTSRPSWRAVLLESYRALSERARTAIATAAVLGERLSPTVLASALGRPVQEVSEDLADAVTEGILHFGETGLAFNHALVRQAIVSDLAPAAKALAHAGIALTLESGGDPAMAGPAAIHWSQVEGREAAERCRDLASAVAASHAVAPERGVEMARLSLEAARRLGAPEEELAERLLVVTRFEWSAGMLNEALESSSAGLELAARVGRPDLAADFALVPQGVGSFEIAGVRAEMCRRALGLLPPSEGNRRARLLAMSAVSAADSIGIPHWEAEGATARSPDVLSAEALTVARESGDPQAELETIAARHFVLSYPQSVAERTVLAGRAVALSGAATTTMGRLWGHLWQADLAFQAGDLSGVHQAITAVEQVASRQGSPVARWHALRLRSAVAVLTGQFAEGRQQAGEARSLAERIGDFSMVAMHHAFHVQLGLLRGDPGELLPGTLDVVGGIPVPLVRASLAVIHGLLGDVRSARSAFAALRDVPARMPLGPRWFGTVGQIGLGAVILGDADVARDCHRLLLPCAQWCAGDGGGSPFAYGSNEFLLGRLAQTFGDLPLAAGHFERGVRVDDRIGATPYAAVGRLALAECLQAAEPARALAVVRDAAEQLDRLDLPGPLARAVQLRDGLAGSGGAPAERPGGLTERELEVARLVGQLLTNQQIADRLFLSVRTVESHVRSALGKLGLARRNELARWVQHENV